MYRKRLLAIAVSIFALGVVFGVEMYEFDTFSFRALFIATLALSVIFIAASVRSHGAVDSKRILAATFAVAAFSFGVLRVSLYNEYNSNVGMYNGVEDFATFEMKDINTNSVDAVVISSEIGLKEGENVRVYLDRIPEGMISGDVFSANVKYSVQYSSNYFSNGISLSAIGDLAEHCQGSGTLYAIRRFVSDESDKLYSDSVHSAAIAKAVTVGDRSDLDSYMFTVYKSAGISHILAISGLHISLIVMSLHSFLLTLSVNKKIACIICSIMSVAYASLVGFTPGAVRSAIMMIILMFTRMFLKRADSVTSLFIALAFILILNPYSLYSVGLQLSFLCSLGIILSEPIQYRIKSFFHEKKIDADDRAHAFLYKIAPVVITPVIVSFSSSAFSFPVLCTSFDTVSYISPLINIIAVPLFSYAIGFSLVAFLIAPVSSHIASIIAYPASELFDLVTDSAEIVHNSDVGVLSTHIPYVIIPLILSILMISALVFLNRSKVKAFALLSVLFCFSIVLCGIYNKLAYLDKTIIEYGDSGGEYVYFQSQSGTIYIDIGGYVSEPSAVLENGTTSVQQYIMHEYDSFSYKRFEYFSGSISVSTLCMPYPKNEYEFDVYSCIKELANERKCDIITFEDDYFKNIDENTQIYIVNDDKLSDGSVVCIDNSEKNIRFLLNGYSLAVNCDIVVICDVYSDSFVNLEAERVYCKNIGQERSETYVNINEFDRQLRMIFETEKEQIEIYEP